MSASSYTFDGPDPDVIFRTPLQPGSDEFKDFHVHKLILSIASTVFYDMFSIPQPPHNASEEIVLDVVQVAEPAKVFETFLLLIYPVNPPVIEDLQLVGDLFQLADKYMVKGVASKLKKRLISPSFLRDDPIGVFAIACRNNLDEEAKLALSHTFSIDVVSQISDKHLQTMTARTYHRLLAEHALRRKELMSAVDSALASRVWKPCHCALKLKKEIQLEISGRPFIDREILGECLSSVSGQNARCGGHESYCILAPGEGSVLLSNIMGRIQAR